MAAIRLVTFLGDAHLPQVGLIQTNQVLNVGQSVVTLISEEWLVFSQFNEAQEAGNIGLWRTCERNYNNGEIRKLGS